MALVTVLRALGVRHDLPLQLCIAHLNHGLRGAAADRDAEFVAARAADWGLPAFIEETKGLSPGTANLEERAREARHRFFVRIAREVGARHVAVGHTLDDQAETVLQRLARGGGARSLAGMEMRREDGVLRPLLRRRRAECRRYLEDLGQSWVEDASNLDARFTRNRIRHDVLPRLAAELGVDVSIRLAALADDLRVESSLADLWLDQALAAQDGDTLSVAAVLGAGPAGGRLLHRWLVERGLRPGRAQVEALVRLAATGGPSGGLDVAGARVERRYDVLTVRRPATGMGARDVGPRRWPAPGAVELGSGWRLSAEALAGAVESADGPREVIVDAAQVEGELTVRPLRRGDRIRLRAGRRKLSDVFTDARIPRVERAGLAVVTRGADIVWVPGVAVAYSVLPGSGTQRRMRLRAERLDCCTWGSVVETQEFWVQFG